MPWRPQTMHLQREYRIIHNWNDLTYNNEGHVWDVTSNYSFSFTIKTHELNQCSSELTWSCVSFPSFLSVPTDPVHTVLATKPHSVTVLVTTTASGNTAAPDVISIKHIHSLYTGLDLDLWLIKVKKKIKKSKLLDLNKKKIKQINWININKMHDKLPIILNPTFCAVFTRGG